MKKINFILLVIILLNGLFAVINQFADSYSKLNNISSDFNFVTMPTVDSEVLLIEDELNSGVGIPMRYSQKIEVDYNIHDSGTWEETEDAGMLWRLGIYSPEALGIKLLFDKFWLPEGSELFIYSKDYDMGIGPYTNQQNHSDGTFGTPLVKSDFIVIEYYQPENVYEFPQLNIDKIFHAYRDIHSFFNNRENRDCGDNVACSSANAWEDQINSVIYLEMYQYICSAALINNTAQDLKPYVLTAYHCVEGEGSLGSHNNFTFFFNHEGSTCSSGSGYYGHSVTGSTIRSWGNMSSSDFALLEMDDNPPSWWNPYFAGWSRYSSQTIGSGIHHPGGQPKKINFDNDTASNCGWYGSNTHYCLNWDQGGTAGGSSGSPIFNSSKLIMGQLSGGSGAECSGSGTDYYGKFVTSWSNSNSSNGNLKYWLDPTNSNSYTLQGTYDGATIVYGCTDSSACNYDPEATNNDGSCSYSQGTCNCDGEPIGNYCNCDGDINDECNVCGGDGSSCVGSVYIRFGNSSGSSGLVEIIMENDVSIAGYQFEINDSPDLLSLVQVSGGTTSENNLTISSSESGTIVSFALTATSIPPGNDILLNAVFEDTSTGNNAEYQLCLSNAIFSDVNANSIPVVLGECIDLSISNYTIGDLNSDGLVNILDVVSLVNIVIGVENFNPAGDINSDTQINVLDVVMLVNMILS